MRKFSRLNVIVYARSPDKQNIAHVSIQLRVFASYLTDYVLEGDQ